MVYCSKCGYPQSERMAFCPACGQRKIDAPQPPSGYVGYYAAQSGPRGFSWGAFLGVVCVLAFIGLALARVTSVPPCATAMADIQNLHPVVFSAMRSAGLNPEVSCGVLTLDPIGARRYVTATWTYSGQEYAARYGVDANGLITDANATAVKLDQAANSGSSALLGLLR